MNKQLVFVFMDDLLTPEELILQLIGEQSRREFEYCLVDAVKKLKL